MSVEGQRGFVLVSSIWLTLIMLFFAGLFSYVASNQFEHALHSKQRTQDSLDGFATEQTFLYLFATNSASREGLGLDGREGRAVVRLDGSIYKGFGRIRFDVTDYSGLVGLNTLSNYHLARLLEPHEASGLEREILLNTLYDYIDLDDFPKLNGGEDAAYRVARMEPPTNDYLRSPLELYSVLGWQDWLDAHPEFKVEWLSTNWRSRVNINNLPEELFARLLDVPKRETERLMNRRREQPFRNMEDVAEVLNFAVDLEVDYFTFLPSDKVRLRINNGRNLETVVIRFSPFGQETPWEIDYRYQSESDHNARKPAGPVGQGFFDWQLPATAGQDLLSGRR